MIKLDSILFVLWLLTTFASIPIAIVSTTEESEICHINLRDIKQSSPIILSLPSPGIETDYLYPKTIGAENLFIDPGESIGIICQGVVSSSYDRIIEAGSLLHKTVKLMDTPSIVPIMCKSGTEFKLEGGIYNFRDLHCEEKNFTRAILRKYEGIKCGNGQGYEIGYDLGNNGFLRTIDLCFNEEEAKTLWAHSVIQPSTFLSSSYIKIRYDSLIYGRVFRDVKKPYNKELAYELIDSILDIPGVVDEYLSKNLDDNKYLSRGHLVAVADKLYPSERDSTNFFVNVVPMWIQINLPTGNWYQVERYVRILAMKRNQKLDMWSGGIGILELRGKKIYISHERKLKAGQRGQKFKIPVPKVLYKCVVDKEARESICFLVVNNPYVTREEVFESDEYRVCKSIIACSGIGLYRMLVLEEGYTYCCRLKDFYERNNEEILLDEFEAYLDFKTFRLPHSDSKSI